MVLAVAVGILPEALKSWFYFFAFVILGFRLYSWCMAIACLDSGVPFITNVRKVYNISNTCSLKKIWKVKAE